MPQSTDYLETFLAKAGWGQAERKTLAGDASNRSYDRLTDTQTGQRAVLMKVPAESAGEIDLFVKFTNLLREMNFSAPFPISSAADKGLLLLEDFGDDLMARLCESDAEFEANLYQVAVDLLVELASKPVPDWVLPYNMETYLREARLLTDWYLPAVTGHKTPSELLAEFEHLIQTACAPLSTSKQVLVLRDYHSENLLWLPDRKGTKRIGLLDYQDALLGHPAYDLVSLLEDARRDTSTSLQNTMIERYCAATEVESSAFTRDYKTLGMQRNIKIIGIFSRLCMRDGKVGYIDLIPRVWAHLQNDLACESLEDLRVWVEKHVPEPTAAALAKIRDRCA